MRNPSNANRRENFHGVQKLANGAQLHEEKSVGRVKGKEVANRKKRQGLAISESQKTWRWFRLFVKQESEISDFPFRSCRGESVVHVHGGMRSCAVPDGVQGRTLRVPLRQNAGRQQAGKGRLRR